MFSIFHFNPDININDNVFYDKKIVQTSSTRNLHNTCMLKDQRSFLHPIGQFSQDLHEARHKEYREHIRKIYM